MYLSLLRTNLCLSLCFFLGNVLLAQDSTKISLSKKYPKNSKVLYHTISLNKDIGTLVVNISDKQEFQYEHWKGDAILVEQEIHLENVPNSVFEALMRKKRYKISEEFQASTLLLQYNSIRKEDLRINYKDFNEKIYLKLLVPEKMNVELNRKG